MKHRILLFLLCLPLANVLMAQNRNIQLRSQINYTDQTVSGLWGYSGRDGREYALLGARRNMIIVDITNPDAPQQIVEIPAADQTWKEIKSYSHFAYMVSEGGGGIQIVDLKDLPSPNLPSHFYTGDGLVAGQLGRFHSLHIDVTKGFLYAYGGTSVDGSPLFNGGAAVFDLKQDPYNPVFVGKFDQLGYIHDGYVDNDTLYSAQTGIGQVAVINMVDKSAPELITTQPTPGSAVHNTWLSADRRTLYATDETPGSYLSAFDVSDLEDVKLLDKIKSTPGSDVSVHNTYVLKNWVLSAWYQDGFTIVDASRPRNLVQVGNYDTLLDSVPGYKGCWSVYPYFPSGTIIASSNPLNYYPTSTGQLFIVTPDFRRAAYVEGQVKDALTGLPLNNVQVKILGTGTSRQEYSVSTGLYETGIDTSGYFIVRFSKPGYQDYETSAYFATGEVVVVDAALFPVGSVSVSGTVRRTFNNTLVDGATIRIVGPINTYFTSSVNGSFSFSNISQGTYEIVASHPTYGHDILSNQTITSSTTVNLLLSKIFRREAGASGRNDALVAIPSLSCENPFVGTTLLQYEMPEAGGVLSIWNALGQMVQSVAVTEKTGQVDIGGQLLPGVYIVRLEHLGNLLQTIKLVKQE